MTDERGQNVDKTQSERRRRRRKKYVFNNPAFSCCHVWRNLYHSLNFPHVQMHRAMVEALAVGGSLAEDCWRDSIVDSSRSARWWRMLLDGVGALNKSQFGVRPGRAGTLVLNRHKFLRRSKWSPLMRSLGPPLSGVKIKIKTSFDLLDSAVLILVLTFCRPYREQNDLMPKGCFDLGQNKGCVLIMRFDWIEWIDAVKTTRPWTINGSDNTTIIMTTTSET